MEYLQQLSVTCLHFGLVHVAKGHRTPVNVTGEAVVSTVLVVSVIYGFNLF